MDSPGASDKALRLWRALNGDLDKTGPKVIGILKRLLSSLPSRRWRW